MSYVVTLTGHSLKINGGHILLLYDKYGVPWFKYSDLLRTLEYRNVSKVIQEQKVDCKQYSELQLTDETRTVMNSRVKERTVKFVNETGLFQVLIKSVKSQSKRFILDYFNIMIPNIRKYGDYNVTVRDKIKLSTVINQFDNMERTVKQFITENYIRSSHGHICVYRDTVHIAGATVHCYKAIHTKSIFNRIASLNCGNYRYSMISYIPLTFNGTDVVKNRYRERVLKRYADTVGFVSLKELKSDLVTTMDELRYMNCYCTNCNSSYKLSGIERHTCNKRTTIAYTTNANANVVKK